MPTKKRIKSIQIEIAIIVLIVIALVGISMVTSDIGATLLPAEDTQKADDLLQAIEQNIADTVSLPGENMPFADGDIRPICKAGLINPACINLDAFVASGYIGAIPVTEAYRDHPYLSGYVVKRTGSKIFVDIAE